MPHNWIDLEGLANARDLGGTPTTDGGEIRPGRLLRSDNLQTLTVADLDRLAELGLTDVIDLRSSFEVQAEGPGPMTKVAAVAIHHHSLLPEGPATSGEEIVDEALPWVGLAPSVQHQNEVASTYLSYIADRPDSIIASLREIAHADGASLVHCAAGKDRTGTVVALSLLLAGAEPEAVVADYAASTERIQGVLDRLLASPTYADNLRGRPADSHATRAETMAAFIDYVNERWGGVAGMLAELGWTDEDTAAMRAKLRD